MRQSGGNQYDTLIKDIFADGSEDLINYFGNLEVSLVGDLKIEFPQVETRISDLVLEAASDQGPLAVHLEFQSRNDREMPYRMLRYALEIHKTYRLPVYQIVIYFGRWEMNMNDTISYHLGAANRLNYRYQLTDVGKISYEELKNSPYPQLRSLLPLTERRTRRKDPEGFLRRSIEDIVASSDLDLDTKRNVLLRAEIFAGLAYPEEFIEMAFQEVEKMLEIEESAGYRRILEKGIGQGLEKGMEQGLEKGMEQGLEKGRRESLVDVTIRLLGKKFRPLPKQYLARIKEQDAYTLQQVIDNIFDINDLSQLDAYLN